MELNEPTPLRGIDVNEFAVSREFTYFVRLAVCIRKTIHLYRKLRPRGRSYAMDAEYNHMNTIYSDWLRTLPADLHIRIPESGTERWRYSAFLGLLHTYHQLGIIIHRRPALVYLMESAPGELHLWKADLLQCIEAAKKTCRIQESMLATMGHSAFTGMLRGMSFTIYTVLTCTMLHLVRYFQVVRVPVD